MKTSFLIISFLICSLKDFSQCVCIYPFKDFSQRVYLHEELYADGKISAKGYIIQIDRETSRDIGLWTRWYPNGQKLSEDIRNGHYAKKYINCWTNTGQQICTNGNGQFLEEGADLGFWDNTTILTIKDSIRQGHFEVYTPYKKKKVKTAEGNYINGLIQGEMRYFYETGQLAIKQIYHNNKDSCWRKEFFKYGKLEGEGIWFNGNKDSIWTYYNYLGNMEKKVTYIAGKEKHGVEFHANGEKRGEGDYVYVRPKPIVKKRFLRNEYIEVKTTILVPVKNGQWIYYNSAGVPIKKETYVNGELVKQ